jgi:hypothetical protein
MGGLEIDSVTAAFLFACRGAEDLRGTKGVRVEALNRRHPGMGIVTKLARK